MPYFSRSASTLPEPSTEALAHSQELTNRITARIDEEGPISFQAYMQMALYESGLGYYQAGCAKFGESGDFVTAPEISPLFGQCIANNIATAFPQEDSIVILELGPGTGQLCVQVLKRLEKLNALPEKYYLLEISPDLQARQKALVESNIPHLLERIEWLESLPESSFTGVILANEVLDALALNRFKVIKNVAVEIGVTHDAGQLQWTEFDKTPADVLAQAQKIVDTHHLPDEYEFEHNVELPYWMGTLFATLDEGFVLLIDYGEAENEVYRQANAQGSLRCFYRHQLVDDPLRYPGLQDITADVNFTAIAEAAVDAGFRVSGYTNQALFLMGSGLDQLIDFNTLSEQARWKASQAIQLLTSPNEMGERFKVMALSKHMSESLDGFSIRDLRGIL